MTSEQVPTQSTGVTLMYSGWQVWDGQYGQTLDDPHYRPVRADGEMVASVEFVQRSAPRTVQSGSPLQVEHTGANWYLATAEVLDTTDAVVLDLGAFRVLRWVRPGEGPGDFVPGTTVALELSLNLNGWPESPWTKRAAELYGTDHRWQVERIVRITTDHDDATEIDEASMETVDGVTQYCLLDCSLVD